jgi:hypothetical protein
MAFRPTFSPPFVILDVTPSLNIPQPKVAWSMYDTADRMDTTLTDLCNRQSMTTSDIDHLRQEAYTRQHPSLPRCLRGYGNGML